MHRERAIGWKAIAGVAERDFGPVLTRFKLDLLEDRMNGPWVP